MRTVFKYLAISAPLAVIIYGIHIMFTRHLLVNGLCLVCIGVIAFFGIACRVKPIDGESIRRLKK